MTEYKVPYLSHIAPYPSKMWFDLPHNIFLHEVLSYIVSHIFLLLSVVLACRAGWLWWGNVPRCGVWPRLPTDRRGWVGLCLSHQGRSSARRPPGPVRPARPQSVPGAPLARTSAPLPLPSPPQL